MESACRPAEGRVRPSRESERAAEKIAGPATLPKTFLIGRKRGRGEERHSCFLGIEGWRDGGREGGSEGKQEANGRNSVIEEVLSHSRQTLEDRGAFEYKMAIHRQPEGSREQRAIQSEYLGVF